jgi:hypothetical protein
LWNIWTAAPTPSLNQHQKKNNWPQASNP